MGETFRPRCQVIIEPGLAQEYRVPGDAPHLDATPDLLRCVATKTMDAPAGTFVFELTYNQKHLAEQFGKPTPFLTWNLVLRENNIVRIAFSRGRKPDSLLGSLPGGDIFAGDEDALVPWMVGLIDEVSESTLVNPGDGRVFRVIRVSGRDLGKIFDHQLHWQQDSLFLLGPKEAARRGEKQLRFYGPPFSMIRACMDILFDDVEFPFVKDLVIYKGGQAESNIDPVTLKPVMDPRTGSPREHGFHEPVDVWERAAFWNLLQRYNDRPWTELYGDTRPDGVYSLYFRPAPFEPDDWDQLPHAIVPDVEILSHAVARDDGDRVNMISIGSPWLNASNYDTIYGDMHYLKWDRFSMKNGSFYHGLHKASFFSPYNQYDPSLPGSGGIASGLRQAAVDTPSYHDEKIAALEKGEGAWADFMKVRVGKVWRWFSPNYAFYSGRFVVKGDPFWRVGYRFENQPGSGAADPWRDPGGSLSYVPSEDERRWYYTQSVAQEWVFPSHYKTHIGVTRGQPLGILLDGPSEGDDLGKARGG